MMYAGRQYDDVSNDAGKTAVRWRQQWRRQYRRSDVGRKFDGRKWDERPTKVGRKSNECPTKVGQTSDKSRMKIQRTSDESRTCRAQSPLGRWRAAALPRNAAAMAGSVGARSVIAALVGNALQLAAFLWRYWSNALDVATLLRWPATRWRSHRCCDGQQRAGRRTVAAMASNALDVATLLRWPATCWTSQRCCDGR
jgi:hypothetical protein